MNLIVDGLIFLSAKIIGIFFFAWLCVFLLLLFSYASDKVWSWKQFSWLSATCFLLLKKKGYRRRNDLQLWGLKLKRLRHLFKSVCRVTFRLWARKWWMKLSNVHRQNTHSRFFGFNRVPVFSSINFIFFFFFFFLLFHKINRKYFNPFWRVKIKGAFFSFCFFFSSYFSCC